MQHLTLAAAQYIAVPLDVGGNVDRHVRLAALAADAGARLVLFPELSLTGYSRKLTVRDALDPHDERLQPLHRLARERRISVVAGAPSAAAGGLVIAAFTFHPDGGLSIYEKQHLHEGEEVAFCPGTGGTPFPAAGETIGIAVCADITHPEHARAAAEAGSTVYAASCFITEAGYQADAALLRRYAVDHEMAVLLSNYGAPLGGWSSAGRSALWSEEGALLAEAPPAGEALVFGKRTATGWEAEVRVV
jgi:predicted amidohydrolase